MNVVSTKKNSKTARNSIKHIQPLPAEMRLLPCASWTWLNTTNVKISLLVKTSENFTSAWECLSHQTPHSPGRITGEMPGICFRRRGGSIWQWGIFKMMSVEYNYKKSFCIKYLLKFKNATEVCQTMTLIWTWKQFTEESWPQLFKRCGWHYPADN